MMASLEKLFAAAAMVTLVSVAAPCDAAADDSWFSSIYPDPFRHCAICCRGSSPAAI